MSAIKIQRTSEFNNQLRHYKLFIDGHEVGIIADGETKYFTTSIGQHTVTAKIDWCSSPDLIVDVKDNEVTTLKLSGFKYGKWLFPVMYVIIILIIIMKFYYGILLMFLLFLYPLYYITIGRKKIFDIERD